MSSLTSGFNLFPSPRLHLGTKSKLYFKIEGQVYLLTPRDVQYAKLMCQRRKIPCTISRTSMGSFLDFNAFNIKYSEGNRV